MQAMLFRAVAHANGEEWDLWTIGPDRRDLRRLTSIAEGLPAASWSPDVSAVAFLGGGSARTAETGLGHCWRPRQRLAALDRSVRSPRSRLALEPMSHKRLAS
jgi:hypothetical protein